MLHLTNSSKRIFVEGDHGHCEPRDHLTWNVSCEGSASDSSSCLCPESGNAPSPDASSRDLWKWSEIGVSLWIARRSIFNPKGENTDLYAYTQIPKDIVVSHWETMKYYKQQPQNTCLHKAPNM